MNIHVIATEQKQSLATRGIGLDDAMENLDKPWGGYLVIDQADTDKFIAAYFAGSEFSLDPKLNLQPKILMVLPNQRLSWQYHNRRAEHWRTVGSTVGFYKSQTDDMGELQSLAPGEYVRFDTTERHRLVGLDEVGIVAEIWQHIDPDNPSDEDDIVRVQDDYQREDN